MLLTCYSIISARREEAEDGENVFLFSSHFSIIETHATTSRQLSNLAQHRLLASCMAEFSFFFRALPLPEHAGTAFGEEAKVAENFTQLNNSRQSRGSMIDIRLVDLVCSQIKSMSESSKLHEIDFSPIRLREYFCSIT
jgi:hypothetical protein